MLSKRIIVCLDVRNGQLTKGVKFQGNVDIGDPVDAARSYYLDGADEIVFYDITASAESRGIMLQVVERVAEAIFIPFSVGGGISTVARMRDVLLAGAEKISVNSAAVRYPGLISDGAEAFGSQAVVLGLDAKKVPLSVHCPSGYEVVIDGGRTPTGLDALAWALKAESLGAGEICLNSIDADGTLDGYELNLTRLVSDAVEIPVIASGGAGRPEHLYDALTAGCASAALVASIVHYGTHPIPSLKDFLCARGLAVRILSVADGESLLAPPGPPAGPAAGPGEAPEGNSAGHVPPADAGGPEE
jgi:cyclase